MSVVGSIPTSHVTVPTILRNAANGRLDSSVLRSPDYHTAGAYQLFAPVSYAMQAMHLAAKRDGIELDSTGRYRSYDRQLSLFLARYSSLPIFGRPTKQWNGKTWWQKPGVAMAATPGTSNHGLGLADDIAKDDNDDHIVESITAPVLTWLRDNAWRFGFGLEQRIEPWHWHWIGGNELTQVVVDELDNAGIQIPDLSGFGFTVPKPTTPPPPPAPDPIEEDDMPLFIARDDGKPTDPSGYRGYLTLIGDGKESQRVMSAQLDELDIKLTQKLGAKLYDPTAPYDAPRLVTKRAEIPALPLDMLYLLVGRERTESVPK